MMKLLTATISILLTATIAFSQGNSKSDGITWVTLEEAQALNEKEPRKIMIDLYTNWCGWCKRMDATTFRDSAVVDYINKEYYAVKLNAETRDTVFFKGHGFVNPNPSGRRSNNQIASIGAREDGRLGFPTIVYLNEALDRIGIIPGYQDANSIMVILSYFNDDAHLTTPWADYQKAYQASNAAQ